MFDYAFRVSYEPDLDVFLAKIVSLKKKMISCSWDSENLKISFSEKLQENEEQLLSEQVSRLFEYKKEQRLILYNNIFDIITWTSKEFLDYNNDDGVSKQEVLGSCLKLTTTKTCWVATRGYYPLLDSKKCLQVDILLLSLEPIDQEVKICFVERVEDFPLETVAHVGWKIINGSIFSSNSDGERQVETNTSHFFSDIKHLTFCVSESSVRYFVDGIFVSESLGNIPRSRDLRFYVGTRSITGNSIECNIGRVLILQNSGGD